MTATPTPPLRVLLPFDDSDNARRAVERVIALAARGLAFEVHLLNVQPPLRSDVTSFVPAAAVRDLHTDEGLKVLAHAAQTLREAHVTVHEHVGVGHPAEIIADRSAALGAELVVMGTHGRSAVGELLLGSVASGVVRQVDIPVVLVR